MKSKIDPFVQDVDDNEGYVYTTNDRLSSRLWASKMEELVLGGISLEGKRVLDVGCGDGYFTLRYHDVAHPSYIAGIDPAPNAVAVAAGRIGDRNMNFCVAEGNHLPWADNSFDVVLLQAMLHHDDDPLATIKEAFRLAPEIVILEPNGNNLGLKIIEKASKYHREHHERSYPTPRLRRWVNEAGGTVVHRKFGNLVPIFCPDRFVGILKRLEPVVEALPVVNALGSGVVVIVARR